MCVCVCACFVCVTISLPPSLPPSLSLSRRRCHSLSDLQIKDSIQQEDTKVKVNAFENEVHVVVCVYLLEDCYVLTLL